MLRRRILSIISTRRRKTRMRTMRREVIWGM